MENQVENNKLIAEFMDVVFHDDENQYYDHEGYYIGLNLKYNTSWDWLMPVVEKCYNTDILEERNVEYEPSHSENLMGDITHALVDINLQKTHEAVVEFIKWYNENK